MIELTERIIPSPKKLSKYTCTFNNTENHSFESKLERIKMSKGKFRKALYPMIMKVKNNSFRDGIYGFIFNDFKVVARYIPNEKVLFIITLLSKDMRNNEFKVKYPIKILKWFR